MVKPVKSSQPDSNNAVSESSQTANGVDAPTKPSRKTLLVWGLFLAGSVITVAMGWGRQQLASVSNQLPQARFQSVHSGWADESRCAECHLEGESFWETGHAQSLRPATDPESLNKLKELNDFLSQRSPASAIEFSEQSVQATYDRDGIESRVQLDWCFGSGRHAQTWTGSLPDSQGLIDLLEYRWSSYHEIDSFDVTPGQPKETQAGYFGGLGMLFDAPKAKMCFACHASSLEETSGRIDLHTIKAGVTCQRCHGPRQQHVASEGAILGQKVTELSQMESVNRCAECHRRAEEQEPGEVRRDNHKIVRFQPVGLVQSPCFKGSEMTCVTCHDPHRTLEAQDSLGIWQCVQCHDGTDDKHILCGAGEIDNCIQCHMPKVQMSAPLQFTDHWIRVRHAGEAN